MIIVYNMGNFKTGKAAQLVSKQAMESYVALGYKLISVAWVSNKEFMAKCSKGLKK
jgi:hypothetical protein